MPRSCCSACRTTLQAKPRNGLPIRRCRILDASTAHRVTQGWAYGLPELVAGQREQIAKAQRVANPGCYSSAVILLVRPLVDAEVYLS